MLSLSGMGALKISKEKVIIARMDSENCDSQDGCVTIELCMYRQSFNEKVPQSGIKKQHWCVYSRPYYIQRKSETNIPDRLLLIYSQENQRKLTIV